MEELEEGKPGKHMIATILTSIFCVLFMETFLFPNYICIYFIYMYVYIFFNLLIFLLLKNCFFNFRSVFHPNVFLFMA